MPIDIEKFVTDHQQEIISLVNAALNRAGDIIGQKIQAGEIGANMQEVLPVMFYEVLLTNTVSTLRLAADMINENEPKLD